MNAITPQRIGTPGHRGRRVFLGGTRRVPGAYSGRSVTQTAARASGGAPLRREDFAVLVCVLETQGHFTPAPPDPPWADPRPDLVGDHARWLTLLELAYRRDGADPNGVFGALNGIRCCGAAITSSGGAKPAWRLTRRRDDRRPSGRRPDEVAACPISRSCRSCSARPRQRGRRVRRPHETTERRHAQRQAHGRPRQPGDGRRPPARRL